MDYKSLRQKIQEQTNSRYVVVKILNTIGIDVTRDHYFKVREERTPSVYIYKDGVCYDFGSGKHYSDVISLFYDGYKIFNNLPQTMFWICEVLNINIEDFS